MYATVWISVLNIFIVIVVDFPGVALWRNRIEIGLYRAKGVKSIHKSFLMQKCIVLYVHG